MDKTPIQKFYKGSNVFITGGTGFMGKILIEKLLRSTEVDTLYLLIREKKGKNMHVRIDELFEDLIFNRLKRKNPKFRHRVEAMSGDCSVSGLGMSITDRQTLISNINIVFHVAATVRFDENLKLAYNINVSGVKDVIDLARQMKNLKSMVHVSTAYSNCYSHEIDEKIYDCPVSYDDVKNVIEKVSKHEAELLTPRLLGKWPNTYTFTKALAESMIRDVGGGLPLAIFRPSIIVSTYKEPIEGWIDNLYGPTGVCAGAISGVLRVSFCSQEKVADIVPVDMCVASLIATAWDVSLKKIEKSSEISVYNYVSSTENPITWKEVIELNIIHGKEYPTKNSLWEPFVIFPKNFYLYWFLAIFLETIPGLILDGLALLTGNKPRMLKIYKRVHKFSLILAYFSSRSWAFSNKNVKNLWEKLDDEDKEIFPFSITRVHWLMYFRRYMKGIRKYLLNDPDSTLEDARKKDHWFSILNMVLKYLLIFLFCDLIFKGLSLLLFSWQ